MTLPISVILTVHNGEAYLETAVSSLLDQTFEGFELIAVDDGSTDNTLSILQRFEDPRIRLIKSSRIGRTPALNLALSEARGRYVAVQDSDDRSLPERFERQIAYLETHSDIVLLGTRFRTIDGLGNRISSAVLPTAHQAIGSFCVYHNPFAHSSVMYRRVPIVKEGGYPKDHPYVHDFALWLRLMARYQVAILPEELVDIRVHSGQMTHAPALEAMRYREEIRLYHRAIALTGSSIAERRDAIHEVAQRTFRYASHMRSVAFYVFALSWLMRTSLLHRHICRQIFNLAKSMIKESASLLGHKLRCNFRLQS